MFTRIYFNTYTTSNTIDFSKIKYKLRWVKRPTQSNEWALWMDEGANTDICKGRNAYPTRHLRSETISPKFFLENTCHFLILPIGLITVSVPQ